MDIADDVERSMLIASVYPERLALHDGRIDGLFGLQGENVSEAFALQEPLRSTHLVALPMDDILPDGAVGSLLVPIDHDSLRHVEDDANDEAVVPLGEFDQRLARLRLDIRRIDDGQAAALQPLRGDQMQHLEGRGGRILRILIIRHQRATEVGGNNLGRFEVLTGKGRFPRSGRADQDHESEFRNLDRHWLNTAICVGGPTSGSSVPTGRNRTAYWCSVPTRFAHAWNSRRVHSNR